VITPVDSGVSPPGIDIPPSVVLAIEVVITLVGLGRATGGTLVGLGRPTGGTLVLSPTGGGKDSTGSVISSIGDGSDTAGTVISSMGDGSDTAGTVI
jgi:hypothetical protein